MKRHIYADNAATTRLNKEAFEAMIPWLTEEYANPSQPYSLSRQTKKAVADARATIAACINAEPDEIFFTSGGTESDNWAIKGTAFACNDKKTIITSQFEHHAVYNSCRSLERLNYPVVYIKPDLNGHIDAEKLKRIITNRTLLVSIMTVNNEIGTLQNILELVRVAHENGVIFHTDAVQAVGHIQIDVKELGVDLLSASAHKFNGPKGIGFLYVKKGTKINPYLDGGSQEKSLRAGTENVASIVGMAKALEKNCLSLDDNIQKVRKLETVLLQELVNNGITFTRNGFAPFAPGILSLSFNGIEGEALLHRLDLLGISVSTGAACDSVKTQVSHVLKSIDISDDTAKSTIRISLSKDNTFDEMKCIVKSLKQILS